METVNNIAAAASKAIWGDQPSTTTEESTEQKDVTTSTSETTGKEPISGELGNVKAGEPYDKGNIEPEPESTLDFSSNNLPLRPAESVKATKPSDATAITLPKSETESAPTPNPTSAFNPEVATSITDSKPSASTNQECDPFADLKYTNSISTEPSSFKDTSTTTTTSIEPKSESLEPLSGGTTSTAVKGVRGESLEKESIGTGTGEQHVKSTGFKADGGDFDATNPGAGREADRLLAEKGIQHAPRLDENCLSSKSDEGEDVDDGKGGKEKKSLKDKIKAKLHKH